MKMKRLLIKEYLISLLVLAGLMFLILGEKSYAFRSKEMAKGGNFNIYGTYDVGVEPGEDDKVYLFPALNSENFMGVRAGPVTYSSNVSLAVIKHLHFGSFNIIDPSRESRITTNLTNRRGERSDNVIYTDPDDQGHPGEFLVITNQPRELVLLVDKSQREIIKVTPSRWSDDSRERDDAKRGVTKEIDLTPTVRPQAPVVAEEDSNKVVGGPSGNIGLTDNGRGWYQIVKKYDWQEAGIKSGYEMIRACKAGKNCKDVGDAANFVFLPGRIIKEKITELTLRDDERKVEFEATATYYERYGYGLRTDPKTGKQVRTELFVRGSSAYDRTVLVSWGKVHINEATPAKFLPRTYYRILEERILVGTTLGRNPIVVGHDNNGTPIYEPKRRFNPRSEGDLGPFSTYTIKRIPNTELYRIKFLVHASLHFDSHQYDKNDDFGVGGGASVIDYTTISSKMLKLFLQGPKALGFLIIKVAYN